MRWVYVQYLKGKTVHWIKTQLNEQNIPTALGKKWQHQTVLSLLDCHHMAGRRVFRGEEIGPGTWPAIIPVGAFREVQERRGYRAAAGHAKAEATRTGTFCTLRPLVWCTACGVRMAGGTNKGRPTYQCNSERDGKACRRRISATVLEPFAADGAIRMLTHLDVTGREAAAVLGSDDADGIAADQEPPTPSRRSRPPRTPLRALHRTGHTRTRPLHHRRHRPHARAEELNDLGTEPGTPLLVIRHHDRPPRPPARNTTIEAPADRIEATSTQPGTRTPTAILTL